MRRRDVLWGFGAVGVLGAATMAQLSGRTGVVAVTHSQGACCGVVVVEI